MFPNRGRPDCFTGPRPGWQDPVGMVEDVVAGVGNLLNPFNWFPDPSGQFTPSTRHYLADAAMKESLSILDSGPFRRQYRRYEDDIRGILSTESRQEELLAKQLLGMLNKASVGEIESKLAGEIGRSVTNMIKRSFDTETYIMVIKDKPFGIVPRVNITRGGKEFMPSLSFRSIEDVEKAIRWQYISLVIEIFFFILSVIGIAVHINDMRMRAAMDAAEEVVNSTQFQRAIDAFLRAWETGNKWQKALAIFMFLKDGVPLAAFWEIIKAILYDMSTQEYIEAVAKIIAHVVVVFGTDGAALIAKIYLSLSAAAAMERKVENIKKLYEIKSRMK